MTSQEALIKPGRLVDQLSSTSIYSPQLPGLAEATQSGMSQPSGQQCSAMFQSESCESLYSDLGYCHSDQSVPDVATDRDQPYVGLEVPVQHQPPPCSLQRSASDSCFQESAIIPTAASIASSPHCPILLTGDHPLPGTLCRQSLPVNDGRPIPIESPLFSGRACVFICGVPSAPPQLFQGQKRKTMIVVQGRFRGRVGYDDLVTGQEFVRAKNLPPAWLLDKVLLKVARAMSPSMTVGPSHAPSMLMPVVAGCNQIHVAEPGGEPPVGNSEPREDMRLVDPRLADPSGDALPVAQRRAFFSDAANRAGRTFDPALVWTFYFYQHLVDVSSYTLRLVYKFHLPHYLDGQPLQLMMRDRKRGEYLFRFLMWHEDLLEDAKRHAGL